jgi:hypothetical protein
MGGELGRRLFGVVMLLSVAGCSAPVLVSASNRDSSYQQKITRVLVTTSFRAPDLSATQNEGFVRASEIRQSLAAAWGPLGVSFEIVDLNSKQDVAAGSATRFTPLKSGQEAAVEAAVEAAARFAPQQILELTLKSYTLYKYVVDAYTVDASLTDVATKRRVWRSSVEFKGIMESGRIRHSGFGGAISHQNDADDLVQALTAKLKADGLL